jgi:hypothetical protein
MKRASNLGNENDLLKLANGVVIQTVSEFLGSLMKSKVKKGSKRKK